MSHMGITSCTKLYLSNGGIKEKETYSGDYIEATEQFAGMYAFDNFFPVNSIK